jgi:AcrR family transcriptional regulator
MTDPSVPENPPQGQVLARRRKYELDVGFRRIHNRAVAEPTARVRVPSQDRAIRTRQALLAAAEREFSLRGYAAATAKTIAERAEVATGSFYQYFESKDALLRELASARLARIVERSLALLESAPRVVPTGVDLLEQARTRMRAVVGLVMEAHREDPGLHAVLTERRHADRELDQLTAAGERHMVERIAALLERWGGTGDRLAKAFVLFGMIEGSVHAHVLGEPIVSDARFVAALVDALLRGAMPPPLRVAAATPPRARGRASTRLSGSE